MSKSFKRNDIQQTFVKAQKKTLNVSLRKLKKQRNNLWIGKE